MDFGKLHPISQHRVPRHHWPQRTDWNPKCAKISVSENVTAEAGKASERGGKMEGRNANIATRGGVSKVPR